MELNRPKLDAAEVTNQVLADDCGWPLGLAADNRRQRRSLDLVGLLVDNARENPVAVGHNLARTDNQREFKSVQLGLAEIAFGDWEGFTIAQLHECDPQGIARREHDKWHFVPPGGESYEMVFGRMRAWYESLTRDTVATAHGGTARGLIALFGIAKPAAAPLVDVMQGEVYVFKDGQLTRYA